MFCFSRIEESRADAPCAWRSLQMAEGLDVMVFAHLPLHSLTQVRRPRGKEPQTPVRRLSPADSAACTCGLYAALSSLYPCRLGAPSLTHARSTLLFPPVVPCCMQPIGLGDRATLALSVCMTPPPLSTLDDALANLARCSLSMSSARGLREVHVVPSTCDPNYSCPSLLRLLLFFPCAEKLSLDMRELGAEELACLSASRSFCSGVQELLLGCSRLHPGFLAPGLWDVFPQLHTLCFQKSATLDLPVADIVQCLAARPSSTKLVLRGLRLVAKGAKKELRDQLAALDGCNVWVMS